MGRRRIAMLGSGNVGRTLGAGLLRHGHEVVLGSRDVGQDRVKEWLAEAGDAARAADYAEAVRWAEWVFVCVPGRVAAETVSALGADTLAGKAVVDVTNRIAPRDGSMTLLGEMNDSIAERVQSAAPDARVLKAFNSVGSGLMVDPDLPGGPPTMFVCGDDADAKRDLAEILRDLGWDIADLGSLASAPLVEAMGAVWVQYGRANDTRAHAFKLLRA